MSTIVQPDDDLPFDMSDYNPCGMCGNLLTPPLKSPCSDCLEAMKGNFKCSDCEDEFSEKDFGGFVGEDRTRKICTECRQFRDSENFEDDFPDYDNTIDPEYPFNEPPY